MSLKISDRQYPLSVLTRFTFEDLTSGTAAPIVELPPGAVVTGGMLVVETAFDSATSDTLVVGDADTADRYAAAVDGQAAAATALTVTGLVTTTTTDIVLTWTGVGAAPTQGVGYLVVTYIREDRSQENQG